MVSNWFMLALVPLHGQHIMQLGLKEYPSLTTYHGIYNSNSWLKDQYNSIMVKGKHIIANSHFTKDHIVTQTQSFSLIKLLWSLEA
jgi:hypothetical protein